MVTRRGRNVTLYVRCLSCLSSNVALFVEILSYNNQALNYLFLQNLPHLRHIYIFFSICNLTWETNSNLEISSLPYFLIKLSTNFLSM
jgi:hypothetical protein